MYDVEYAGKRWDTLVSFLIEKLGMEDNSTGRLLITLGGVLLCIIIPYLLGSINFGLLISKKKYHDDIRTHGSGNAGTTNMLRTYGKRAAVLTLVGDMLKAAIAVGLGYLIFDNSEVFRLFDENNQFIREATILDTGGAAIAGLFVMLGHMFPIFYRFKGGKGVATSAVVVLMISWPSFLLCALIFIVIVVGTKYVSLASCMGMIFYPIILNAYQKNQNPLAKIAAIAMATMVVFMHRENLKRLTQGKESKIYFSKKKREEAAAAAAAAAAAEAAGKKPRPEPQGAPKLLDRSAIQSKPNKNKKKKK